MKIQTIKLKYIAALMTSMLLLSSCNDDFLEVDPDTQIPSNEALKSGKNVEATLISAYSDMVSNDVLGQRAILYSELKSDNIALDEITLDPTDFTGQVAFNNTNVLNKDVDYLWSNGYRAIARANAVINAVDADLITDGTAESSQLKWKAEALFIRGVIHFELVRLFALPYSNNPTSDLGIPIRIKYLTQDEKLPRSTVDEVYDQVIADLTAAITLLPEQNGNRATSWAAKGYLARVYFNMLDYENASAVAADVIENSGATLQDNPFAAFRNSGNVSAVGGVVFQIINSGNPYGDFRSSSSRYSLSQGANGSYSALEASGGDDFRAGSEGIVTGTRIFSRKWDTNVVNPPIIRLAEIYLIHAESAANLEELDDAAESYNTVRDFAVDAYTPVAFGSKAEALEMIQAERRIELLLEGDRYHELRRLKAEGFGEIKKGSTVIREAANFNDTELLLKIPVSETSGNPEIIQN